MEAVMRKSALVLLLTALPLAAEAGPKVVVPAMLERARYVALGYDLGDGFVSESELAAVARNTLTEERQALQAIHDDLAEWGRFVVTERPGQAEIFIAIRVGRHGTMDAGKGSGSGRAPSGGGIDTGGGTGRHSTSLGATLSSSDDRLDVYESQQGATGMRLWSAAAAGGLSGAPPRLYKAFRKDIEAADAAKAAKKP
jgi:hypothetical protein